MLFPLCQLEFLKTRTKATEQTLLRGYIKVRYWMLFLARATADSSIVGALTQCAALRLSQRVEKGVRDLEPAKTAPTYVCNAHA